MTRRSTPPKPTIASIAAVPRTPISLDTPLSRHGYEADGRCDVRTPAESIADAAPSPEDILIKHDERQLLRDLLQTILTPVQALIIEALYLDSAEGHELAKLLHCRTTDVWPIRDAALQRLRTSPHAAKVYQLLKGAR